MPFVAKYLKSIFVIMLKMVCRDISLKITTNCYLFAMFSWEITYIIYFSSRVADYRKESNTSYQIQMDLADLTELELESLSLDAPEMPRYTADSSLLDTLTGGMDDGDESILEGLDIKRPPVSYQSGT